jgi:hypothetical protein
MNNRGPFQNAVIQIKCPALRERLLSKREMGIWLFNGTKFLLSQE